MDDIATASSDPERYGLCAAPEFVTIVAPLVRDSHGGQRYRATQPQHATARSFGRATPPTTPPQPSPHPSAQWGEPVNHLPIDPSAHMWTVDTAHARRREPDVVATIPLGGHARNVVVRPGGDHIYATTANSVSVIDHAPGERRPVAGLCHGLRRFDVDHQRRGPYRETVGGQATTTEAISPHDNYVCLFTIRAGTAGCQSSATMAQRLRWCPSTDTPARPN